MSDSDDSVRIIDFGNKFFQRQFKKLPQNIQREARRIFGELILKRLMELPAKLHFHNLKDKKVKSALEPEKTVPVYTIHISSDDTYKASFTLENGTAYFRSCGKHDEIDGAP